MDIQPTTPELLREDISEYVAQLQLHMALQARNLIPSFTNTTMTNSRQQMLQETQRSPKNLLHVNLYNLVKLWLKVSLVPPHLGLILAE